MTAHMTLPRHPKNHALEINDLAELENLSADFVCQALQYRFKANRVYVSSPGRRFDSGKDACSFNHEKRFVVLICALVVQTYVGNVLIALNPFSDLGLFTDEFSAMYSGSVAQSSKDTLLPHLYAIANNAYM